MKKLSLFIGIFILFSLNAFAGSFPDVPEDHENYEAIEYLDNQGIIHGYQDGTFQPDKSVNRAEAMKIVVSALGIYHEGDFSETFPDVLSNEWFFPFVMGGYDANIINGYDDGTFKPGNQVNLAEMLKIVVLGANVSLPGVTESNVFLDVPSDAWYAPHALYARDHNLILPDDYGNLHAENSMTRADVAELLYRMMIVRNNNGEPFPLHNTWDLYVSSVLPFKMKYDSNNWELIEYQNEVVFFRGDKEYQQFSPIRIYPNSAVVRVVIDDNEAGTDVSQYFSNIRLAFDGATFKEFEINGMKAFEVLLSEDRIVDWYLYLDNGDVMVVYTEFGDGTLGFQLTRYIQSMLSTFEFNNTNYQKEDYSSLLSEIFGNVLVEGKGMEMINKLPDKIIIETDAIGVGTGPIDYYYSENVNYTFKYERAGDVILDTREGQTTAF